MDILKILCLNKNYQFKALVLKLSLIRLLLFEIMVEPHQQLLIKKMHLCRIQFDNQSMVPKLQDC